MSAPQLALDFTGAPYAPDSPTSRRAAQAVTPTRGDKMRVVLDCIRAAGTYERTRHRAASREHMRRHRLIADAVRASAGRVAHG